MLSNLETIACYVVGIAATILFGAVMIGRYNVDNLSME